MLNEYKESRRQSIYILSYSKRYPSKRMIILKFGSIKFFIPGGPDRTSNVLKSAMHSLRSRPSKKASFFGMGSGTQANHEENMGDIEKDQNLVDTQKLKVIYRVEICHLLFSIMNCVGLIFSGSLGMFQVYSQLV